MKRDAGLTQWLRAHADLVKDLDSQPTWWLTNLIPVLRDQTHSFYSFDTRYTLGAHTCLQAKHLYTLKVILLSIKKTVRK